MTTCEKTGAKATMMCKNCGSAQEFEKIRIKVSGNGLVADGTCWVCSKCHKRQGSFWTDSWDDPFIDSWGGWLFEMWPFGKDIDKILGEIVDKEIAKLEAPKTEELEQPKDCGKTCKQIVNDDIRVVDNSEKAIEPKAESKHKDDLAHAVAVTAKVLGEAIEKQLDKAGEQIKETQGCLKKQHVNDKPYDDTLALFEVCNAMLEPWDVIVTDADLGDWVCEYYAVYKNEDLEFERWLRKPRMVIEKRQGLRVIVDGREIWVRDGVIYCDKDIGEKIDKAVEKQ